MKHNWTYKKLTDAATINYGTRVVQKRDGGTIYPVYGGGDATFRMDTYNRENCLVVARFAMSPKCTRRVSGKFFLNDSGLTLEAKEGVCQDYLDWHIIALNDEIYRTAKGAAQKNLDVKTFTSLSIGVPSLDEQQAIVQELDGINHLIDLQEEQLREYDRLAQALFYTTFGDPVSNPKGWEVKKIGEVATFINGKAHEQDIDECGSFVLINSKYISSDATIFKRTNRQNEPLYKKDIVMVMSDVPNGKAIAKCLLIKEDDKYTLNQRICAFRDYEFPPLYLLFSLNRNQYYLNFDNGNSQTNLRKDDVLGCPIMCPPLALQQSFAAQIEAIEQQKALIRRSLDETRTLLAARMQYYFE